MTILIFASVIIGVMLIAFIGLTMAMHIMAPYYATMTDDDFNKAMAEWYSAMNRYPWSNFQWERN